ncbi:hypothetical protein DMUE_3268 [Dictyocoela muelleri]|nr:hypothetical protein DMUE_3268 [Dictyocoela muelleri]
MDKLEEKLSKTPIKANNEELKNLKIALNDMLIQFLKINNCKEYCRDKDIKIIIGLTSAILASTTTYISMNYDFEKIKMPLLIMIIFYFVINGGLEIYERFMANYMYSGFYKNKKLIIYSNLHDNDFNYKLVIRYGNDNKEYSKSVYSLFYEDGVLDHEMFLKDLDSVFDFLK